MISYVLPTRNRPERVAETLAALGRLSVSAHEPVGGAEVIVVDDASDVRVEVDAGLANGMPVQLIRRPVREGAAARNAGFEAARGEWVVMLDDDSYPLNDAAVTVAAEAPADVAAIGADITLPGGRREDGGLPEVFVGCGAAVRRGAFLDAGGYDPAFDYYAEEYDLCAKLLHAGWRVMHDARFRVRHEKAAEGRDMDRILHRLVRNSGWVIQRYAPEAHRERALACVIDRYQRIAAREGAETGCRRGLDELERALARQARQPMDEALWDRFTGLAHARATLGGEPLLAGARAAVVDAGKNEWVVRQVLGEADGCEVVDEQGADALVVGTLSPGPMMDAWERLSGDHRPVLRPWTPGGVGVAAGE